MSSPKALFIEDVCPICRDDFGVDLPMWNIACGHVFCCECLFGIDPKVCPLCREEYEEGDIECVEGLWEERDSGGSERSEIGDEFDYNLNEEQQFESSDEEHWAPSEYEYEEDSAAWEELERGTTYGEDEVEVEDDEDNDLSYVLERIGELHLEGVNWTPSDHEREEDSAAWIELTQERFVRS